MIAATILACVFIFLYIVCLFIPRLLINEEFSPDIDYEVCWYRNNNLVGRGFLRTKKGVQGFVEFVEKNTTVLPDTMQITDMSGNTLKEFNLELTIKNPLYYESDDIYGA